MPYVLKIRSTQTSLIDVVKHKNVHMPNSIECVEFFAYANDAKMQAFCGSKKVNVGEIIDGERITRYHRLRFNNPKCNNKNALATFLNSADHNQVIVEVVGEFNYDEPAKELRNLLIRQAYSDNTVLCLNQAVNAGVHGEQVQSASNYAGQFYKPSLQVKVDALLNTQVQQPTRYRPSEKSRLNIMNYFMTSQYGLRLMQFPAEVISDIKKELNSLERNTLTEFEDAVKDICFDYCEQYLYWH